MNYKSFDLLKKLYFVRTSGSKEELLAANILKEECESLGVKAELDPFEVDHFKIKKAELYFDDVKFNNSVGVGYSGNTPDEGIEGELIYIDSNASLDMFDLKDKIVLLEGKKAPHWTYKKLVEKGVIGLIVTTGSVYKDNSEVDLDPYQLRECDYSLGKIPSMCITNLDAEKLLMNKPNKAKIILKQEEFKGISHNVIAEIKGSEIPNEVVVFTAHYDSVPFSKGIYDNATGSTTIMQLLAYFASNTPKRTVKFVFCGSEEQGLLGSKDYVKKYKDELSKVVLNINVDMTGVTLGFDYACVTGEEDICTYLRYLSNESGFPLITKQGVYSSDSTPFADNGVPAISFARLAKSTGATIHSHDDIIERLSPENYYKTCDFIALFASRMVNSYKFPIKRNIPDNMKLELDYYNLRKERK